MPKKSARRGRGKTATTPPPSTTATLPSDSNSDQEFSVDVVVPIPPEAGSSVPSDEVTQQKKRKRLSKKEVPEYQWTDSQSNQLADIVKHHTQLYDKKQKDWLNLSVKSRLWSAAGAELDPPATGSQCKKHYENMRTRVGKILKREGKSGPGQASRTIRDGEIMQSWSFLTQHITRGKTIASEEFSTQSQASGTPSEVEEEDLSSAGGDLPGIQPPKSRTQRRSSTATVSTQPSHSVSSASEEIRIEPGGADTILGKRDE